jgi:hypothetical protein
MCATRPGRANRRRGALYAGYIRIIPDLAIENYYTLHRHMPAGARSQRADIAPPRICPNSRLLKALHAIMKIRMSISGGRVCLIYKGRNSSILSGATRWG